MDKNSGISSNKSESSDNPISLSSVNMESISNKYKSIVDSINEASEGFKNGKKWKCNVEGGTINTEHFLHKERQKLLTTPTSNFEDSYYHQKNRDKPKCLVRQQATNIDDSSESLFVNKDVGIKSNNKNIRQAYSLDATVRCSQKFLSSAAGAGQNGSTVYLLRPVSRESTRSSSEDQKNNSVSPSGYITLNQRSISTRSQSQSPSGSGHLLSPILDNEQGRSHYSQNFNKCSDIINERNSYSQSSDALIGQKYFLKQCTSDSAPPFDNSRYKFGTQRGISLSSQPLPRQFSNCSYPTAPITRSNIAIVRGGSCSLIDIPTYVGSKLSFNEGVQKVFPIMLSHQNSAGFNAKINNQRPRLQLDLTRKKNNENTINSSKKTKWTVLCVSITLLTMCVTLVGTMLGMGAQYQDPVMTNKWEFNKTRISAQTDVTSLKHFQRKAFSNTTDNVAISIRKDINLNVKHSTQHFPLKSKNIFWKHSLPKRQPLISLKKNNIKI